MTPAIYTVDAIHLSSGDIVRHVVTVKASPGRIDHVFLTSPDLGCSRDYRLPTERAYLDRLDPPIHWFLSEHALLVSFITRVEG